MSKEHLQTTDSYLSRVGSNEVREDGQKQRKLNNSSSHKHLQCSSVFECYQVMSNHKDEKHLPVLKKVQNQLASQTKSRQQAFNKSLSHSSLQSLSMASSSKPANVTSNSRLDIIPERVFSIHRKKKIAKLATKVYGARVNHDK